MTKTAAKEPGLPMGGVSAEERAEIDAAMAADNARLDEQKPPPPLTFWQKIAKAMELVGYVQKRGKNAEHKYTFVQAADVAEKAREAFIEVGLIMLPTMRAVDIRERPTRSGGVATIARVTMHYCLRDTASPTVYEFEMTSEGFDSGDKAIPKAITSAFKYALLQLLMISTGDDPEADPQTDRDPPVEAKITADEAQGLENEVEMRGADLSRLLAYFHVDKVTDLTSVDYRRALAMLDKKK